MRRTGSSLLNYKYPFLLPVNFIPQCTFHLTTAKTLHLSNYISSNTLLIVRYVFMLRLVTLPDRYTWKAKLWNRFNDEAHSLVRKM